MNICGAIHFPNLLAWVVSRCFCVLYRKLTSQAIGSQSYCSRATFPSMEIFRLLCRLLACEYRMKVLLALCSRLCSMSCHLQQQPAQQPPPQHSLSSQTVAFPLVTGNKGQAFVGRMIQGPENTANFGKPGTKAALG